MVKNSLASKIKQFASENRLFLALFAISTAIFLYQHYQAFSWDFTVYVSNAKYWFDGGMYFEPLRPPMMPVILTVFSVFGWLASEYLFIIFASALFAYSTAKLANSLKLDKNIFYILSLNVYVLGVGLVNGTELLSVAFLELFIAALLSGKDSGYWLGFACLSRYNFVSLLPLLIFHKSIKPIIKNGIYFAIPFIPWFAYNYFKFGNIFMSIADIYANNVKFRAYIDQPFVFSHVAMAVNFLLPFMILGLAYVLFCIARDASKIRSFKDSVSLAFEKRAGEIIMIILLASTLYGYNNIPIKGFRYLFAITIPAVYFSAVCIEKIPLLIKRQKPAAIKLWLAVLIAMLSLSALPSVFQHESREPYEDAISRMEMLGIGNCALKSNAWVLLNYLGRTSHDYPWQNLAGYYIDNGYYILLFYNIGEPEYCRNSTFLHSLPVVYENEKYIILGEKGKCAPITKVDNTYVQAVNMTTTLLYNSSTDTDACNLMFEGKITNKICNLVNLRWKK